MKILTALVFLMAAVISYAATSQSVSSLNEPYPVADIDNDGSITALSDGVLVLRHLFGFRGQSLISGDVINANCNRCTSEEIETYLTTVITAQTFDCDSDSHTTPLTDGLLFVRYLLGFTGNTLIDEVVGSEAQNTTSESIIACFSALTSIALQDTTPPAITIEGANPLTVLVGSGAYADAGATALDDVDGVLIVGIDSSQVNTNAVGSYTVIFTVTDSAGNGSSTTRTVNVEFPPPLDGLIGYWPMDETSGFSISDFSGNESTASLSEVDNTTHVSGKLNNALHFNDSRDGTISSAAMLTPESFTIAAYINIPDANGAWQWIASHGDNYGLVIESNGSIHVYYYNGASWPGITINVDDLRDGTWHHIAGSYDEASGTLQAFVDGELVGSGNGNGPISYSAGSDFHIGSMNGSRFFRGDLDELKVFDRALTESEVASLQVSETIFVSLTGGTVLESNSGITQATFDISLSRQSTTNITMNYSTLSGSATDNVDYQAASGAIIIVAGLLNTTVTVNVIGDTNIESDEEFTLHLSNLSGAEATNTQAKFKIRNDDGITYGLDIRPDNSECVAGDRPNLEDSDLSLSLEDTFPALIFSKPVAMEQAPGDDTRFFIVEERGRIKVIHNGVVQSTLFLDIAINIGNRSEDGLYSLAFHPDYQNNGYFYVSFVDANSRTQIDRYTVSDNPSVADPNSELTILERDQPYQWHNNYHIAFGADGFLYIAMGDGGSAGDPDANAQDTSTWLGSMLRIDVDGGSPYAIPTDNPFAGQSCDQNARTGNCPEIYAWGLRSPWRWSFDSQTQDLWLGDVGQGNVEEVDIIEKGKNYGWRCFEGNDSFNSAGCQGVTTVAPVDSYRHVDGACAVTGGFVYRGTDIPALRGTYVYGDLCTGNVFGLPYYSQPETPSSTLFNSASFLVSFAKDNAGELYIISYFGGKISKIIATEGAGVDNPSVPDQLSDSGCVETANPGQPISAMIPFEVNAPHWSDGAHNENWLAIPNGSKIDHQQGDDWVFPIGSVIMKNFILNDSLIETRFMMRHNDGGWGGYTYEWDDDGTDATLVVGGKEKEIDGQMWIYPSAAECSACHTDAATGALAPETVQLNGLFTYPQTGVTANQLESLEKIDMFTELLPSSAEGLLRLVNPYDVTENLQDRAKSWLHTNCSSCHQPGVVTQINIDFRFKTPLSEMMLCNVPPQNQAWGITNPMRLAPGDASRSLIHNRPSRLDEGQMPPIGTNLVDVEGVNLIEQWINGLESCP